MAIPTYYRTAEAWKEPFTSESDFVRRSGLSLDDFKEFRLDDVYLDQFQRDDNAQAFAAAYTGFFKAAYEPCLFVNLSDKRTPESRQHVIDCFRKNWNPRSHKIQKNIRAVGSCI
jgi:hypothetical protein